MITLFRLRFLRAVFQNHCRNQSIETNLGICGFRADCRSAVDDDILIQNELLYQTKSRRRD